MLGRTFSRLFGLALAAALAAGCTSKDATYCDAQVQCPDSRDVCNLALNICERAARHDGGSGDAPAGDAAGTDDGGTSCPPPQRACAGRCYDPDDPDHCGPGCAACVAPAHGQATCDGTSCGFACDTAFWANASACDPCDTASHCGAACGACTAPAHGQATCDGTSCGFTCDSAFWPNGTSCDACDNAAHCGASCALCEGGTPDCAGGQGGQCVCNATSCGGVAPICDATTKQCRACAAHAECASGVCGDDGGCVAAADIIYLRPTACDDGGAGDETTPFCTFGTALAAATAGPRFYILARAGYYHVNGAQQVQNRRVVIVGVAANQTLITQDATGQPVLSVLADGSVSISSVSLLGASGAGGHGILCAGQGGTTFPLVELDQSSVSSNAGNGIDATTCEVVLRRSSVGGNQGLGLRGSAALVTVEQTKISGNHGGGLSLSAGRATVANSLIARNGTQGASGSAVGGVKLDTVGGTPAFLHNTVVDNFAATGTLGAGVWCIGGAFAVTSSILYANYPGQQKDCAVTYSDVQDGATTNHNLTGDPLFVDRPNSDYHLSTAPTASPCIDAGDPSGGLTVDLDGYPRSGTPDMGCYEAH